jgi:lysozyme
MAVDFAALKILLTRHEGRMPRIYVDTVGKVTGGIGHNFTDKSLSPAAIDLLYQEDMAEVVAGILLFLPWTTTLTPARQMVLYDMGFNLGVPGLLKFVNTLAFIRAGAYDKAATAMLHSKWATQVGHRAVELANIMRTGVLLS